MSDLREERSSIVWVGGIMGAGKSTLASGLGRIFGWPLLEESPDRRPYVRDILTEPSRWAFEAQVAFVLQKVSGIRRALASAPRVLVDRSLHEDCDVFARYFCEIDAIDSRASRTYELLTSLISDLLPKAQIFIFCSVSLHVALRRLQARARPDDSLFSEAYVCAIADLYTRLIESRRGGPELFVFDGEVYDPRDDGVVRCVGADVERLLAEGPLSVSLNSVDLSVLRRMESTDLHRLHTGAGTP